ncbi:hypothetical protein D3C71_2192150 [compost metagenome]
MGELLVRQVHAAYPIQFSLRAYVHEHSLRVGLQQFIGLLRVQRAEVRKLVLLLARVRRLEEVVSGSHLL